MCGIVYAFKKDGKPAARRVLKRYYKQAERGSDGFGYVALDASMNVLEYQRTKDERSIEASLKASESGHVLFHHRFPTSTVNVPESAHPILVRHKELKHSYYVVHNGVLSNHKTLKPDHEKLGYVYSTEIETNYQTAKGKLYHGEKTFNDSETLAIELARTIEGLQTDVRAMGSIAFMAFQANKAGTRIKALYYGTNGGNTLTLTDDDSAIVIASEGGKAIPANKVFRVDFATRETTLVEVSMAPYYVYSGGTGYPHGSHGYQFARGDFEPSGEDDSYMTEEDYIPTGVYEGMSWEEMQDELYACEADIEMAVQTGDYLTAEELEIEREGILEQMQEYERGLISAVQSKIGF